jgi:DNA gyrase subunit B
MAKAQKPVSEVHDAGAIKVLEGLDPVRRRRAMYIGNTDDRSGLHNLVYNVVDNAIDEALASPASTVTVTLNPDGSCTVRDNGRGMPTDIREEGVLSGGLHAVGVSVVNALSTSLKLTIWRDGQEHFMEFADGDAVAPLKVRCDAGGKRGTEVTFLPSPKTFRMVEFDFATLEHQLRQLPFLNSGVTIVLSDMRHAVEKREEMRYERGVEALK